MSCPALECAALQKLWAAKPDRLANGVPKIIHQTWKSSEVPDHWRPSHEAWQRLHPTWIYLLWTDADMEAYIRGLHPQAWPLFESMAHTIQRVDLWRYFVLHDFGGLYADLDIMPVKAVDAALERSLGSVFLVPSANWSTHYTNAFMASGTDAVSRAFWASVVDHVRQWPKSLTDKALSNVRHFQIIMSTGPMALTSAATLGLQPFVVLPRRLWNPYGLHQAGQLQDQDQEEALVQILEGSSWHGPDSAALSFLHTFKWPLIILTVLSGLYYVIGSQLVRENFARLVKRLTRLRRLRQKTIDLPLTA